MASRISHTPAGQSTCDGCGTDVHSRPTCLHFLPHSDYVQRHDLDRLFDIVADASARDAKERLAHLRRLAGCNGSSVRDS
jgi:hypothetical protein